MSSPRLVSVKSATKNVSVRKLKEKKSGSLLMKDSVLKEDDEAILSAPLLSVSSPPLVSKLMEDIELNSNSDVHEEIKSVTKEDTISENNLAKKNNNKLSEPPLTLEDEA